VTYLDIIAGMESIGLPCNYHKWSQAPALPYTLITHTENDDLMADNHNYFDIGNYRLELYTAVKHPPTEQLVEDWLKAQRIPYGKSSPGFIDSESTFLTAYDIRLIGG
jgi:hypothetical protein